MEIQLSIKYGGESKAESAKSAPAYNPENDKGYIQSRAIINELSPTITQNLKKKSQEEVLASLPMMQRQIIAAQNTQQQSAPGADWSKVNDIVQQIAVNEIIPYYAKQYQNPTSSNLASSNSPIQNYVLQASLLGKGGK